MRLLGRPMFSWRRTVIYHRRSTSLTTRGRSDLLTALVLSNLLFAPTEMLRVTLLPMRNSVYVVATPLTPALALISAGRIVVLLVFRRERRPKRVIIGRGQTVPNQLRPLTMFW